MGPQTEADSVKLASHTLSNLAGQYRHSPLRKDVRWFNIFLIHQLRAGGTMKQIVNKLAVAFAVAAMAIGTVVGAAPVASAQELPGGSIQLPTVEPIPVPAPSFLEFSTLPPLPFPWFWQDTTPKYVASNWVEMGTACPAPHEWAYTQDGTTVWCARWSRTDAFAWAPEPGVFTNIPGGLQLNRKTRVENSLGARPCDHIDDTAVNPSNGQIAYCGMRGSVSSVPIWTFRP